jgi:hypothetical protein
MGCGFTKNFARRQSCFECGVARGGAGAAMGGAAQRGVPVRGGAASTGVASNLVGGLGKPPPPRERSALGRAPISLPGPGAGGLRPQGAMARNGDVAAKTAGRDSVAALLRDGPVGADGRRPLLPSTWAGVAARRPAESMPPHQPRAPAAGGAGAQGPRPRVVDEDGFTLVSRRTGPPQSEGARAGGGTARAASTGADAATPQSGGAAAMPFIDANAPPPGTPRDTGDVADVPMGGTSLDGAPNRPEGREDDEREELGDEERVGPSEAELKEQWQLDLRLLSWVKAQGLADDHPRRLQAEDQAAASKRAWQESKPRAATSSRMRWAEEALSKARKGMARMEQAIDELDQWYEAERMERQQSLHEMRAKVKMREEYLAEIVRQAAEDCVPGAQPLAPPVPMHDPGAESLRTAYESLGQGIGPALEQIREATEEGSAAQQQVNCALAAVADLYGFLGEAVTKQQQYAQWQQDLWWGRQHQQRATAQGEQRWWDERGQTGRPGAAQYDIVDEWAQGGGGWDRWEDDDAGGGYDGWGGQCPWDGGDWQRRGRGPTWDQESRRGPGGLERAEGHHADADGSMDTDEVRGPKWMRRASAAEHDHGERSWKKGRKEEEEPARAAAGTATGGMQCTEQTIGENAGEHQAGQPGAAGARGAGGTGATSSGDAEALAARREEIVRQAVHDGIDAGGVPRLDQGRDALETWASNNLL